jgi:hypothetical protein
MSGSRLLGSPTSSTVETRNAEQYLLLKSHAIGEGHWRKITAALSAKRYVVITQYRMKR